VAEEETAAGAANVRIRAQDMARLYTKELSHAEKSSIEVYIRCR